MRFFDDTGDFCGFMNSLRGLIYMYLTRIKGFSTIVELLKRFISRFIGRIFLHSKFIFV